MRGRVCSCHVVRLPLLPISGDVHLTLSRILEEVEDGRGPSVDRAVIETMGLADPQLRRQTVMTSDEMTGRVALNAVAHIVDTVKRAEVIDRFREAQC